MKLLPTMVLCVMLTGCVTGGSNQTGGTLIGGATGALAGSQFGKGNGRIAATAIGTLLGAMIGAEVGKGMDEEDQRKASQAFHQSMNSRVGSNIRWNNPKTNNSGSIRTTRDGTDDAGRYCKEFTTELNVDGNIERSSGIACQQPNGDWRFQ